jgi:hypothetical protein
MFDIAQFPRFLIACLLAIVLAAGTMSARADGHSPETGGPMTACASQHKSVDGHAAKQSIGQVHCCSIGHCWVATEIGAPLFAVDLAGLRVADLTNIITVSPASTRLERPPQTI